MELVKVSSSNVEAVGYADDKLYVQFTSGHTYAYVGVPQKLYEDLLVADSKGRFLRANVYDKYLYEKLN